MTIAITGLSHHTSPLALRERMALPSDHIPAMVEQFQKRLGNDSGVLILATCNRLEVYVHARQQAEFLHSQIKSFLGEATSLEESEFSDFLYHYSNDSAVRHFFSVAASLDSMVVGENEIMGQIQRASETASNAGGLNRILSMLVQRALKCGKRIRTETDMGKGKVSVASVAVDLAETKLKQLAGKTAMIVGSGQVSELALKSLIERGVGRVMVLNRTLAHAEELASKYQGEAFVLQALPCHLHRADIVISSTGASDIILRASDFQRAIEKRGRAPMFVIDIAVPRDIEKEAAHIDNVYCYDMDDLQGVAERNLRKRQDEIPACLEIVEKECLSFVHWQRRLSSEPLIKSLTKSFNDIRESELSRTLAQLPDLSEEERKELEQFSKRITNHMLRMPLLAIKEFSQLPEQELLMEHIQTVFGWGEPKEE
ncbi:MAG: glutamyl-tRNA reductase [Candidatus Hydrogenedens sp.]|jgi:glutamyl-tRNA reductase|nr:glutamyl-tRNA reductase [Candidatus Hydrogenedens sp.]